MKAKNAVAAPAGEGNDDLDILLGLSRRVLDSPEGAEALLAAAQNTDSPAKGAGQFIIMLMENVSKALEESGIPVDPAAWLANDGALARLTDDVLELLQSGGAELDPDVFAEELYYVVADMAKGIAQAEQGSDSPAKGADAMLAQAPLLS